MPINNGRTIANQASGENTSLAGTEKLPISGNQFTTVATVGNYIKNTAVPPLANYLPDVPPASAGAYDDEFSDDSINVAWTTPAFTSAFNLLQTSGAIHLSESDMHGWLMMQGDMTSSGTYNMYKAFTPTTTQAWTVASKWSLGYSAATNDVYCGIGIRGNADNVFFELRAGRNTVDKGYRTVFANGGAATEGIVTNIDTPLGVYLMITCDGSKNLSAFVSGDGIGWVCIDLNRSLSALTSFTRLSIFTKSGVSGCNGIAAVDFVRYFTTAGQYKIGKDV